MLVVVVSGFVAAAIAPFIVPRLKRRAGLVLATVPLGLFAWLLGQAPAVVGGATLTHSTPWVPSLGVSLDFRLDGLSLVFALLVTGVGVLVTVYAHAYLGAHRHLGRFYLYLHAFMAAMLGLVLADDLIALFVFWELTSLTSYLLVGFKASSESSRKAALQALLITGGGGLALLAGLLLLGAMVGDLSMGSVLTAPGLSEHPLYAGALLLIAAGAFTKSAQFPFHIWLPGAMAAPTPVSAYLHSATMVKAGVYLLARLSPALGGTVLWTTLLTAAGGLTLLVAGVLALGQRDLKRLLAYSTVAALGTMVLLIGVGTPVAIRAMLVVLLSHALYKGALFLVAGIVDHETGTRDVTRLAGLRRRLPKTAVAAALAGLSMAGLPPLLGFVGKELFYEATLYGSGAALVLTLVAVAGNAMTVAVAGIIALAPFWGSSSPLPRGEEPGESGPHHHGPSPGLWVPPALLAVAGLLAELVPGLSSAALIRPASSAVLGMPDTVKLSLWHGLTPMLGLSVLTVLAGVGLYLGRARWRSVGSRLSGLARFGPDAAYERGLKGLVGLATAQTRALQSGYLRHYVTWILVTLIALVTWALLVHWQPVIALPAPELGAVEWVLAAAVVAAVVVTVRVRSRLAAVAALGAVGLGIALLFLLFSAPDLAVTQFAVETLAVLLFVFVLYKLPRFARLSSTGQRLRDAALALSVGGLMTVLVLAITTQERLSRLAPWLAENSVPEGKGRNVVNVILVDFRALDTLGEIVVLTVAAIGVYALLKLRPRGDEELAS